MNPLRIVQKILLLICISASGISQENAPLNVVLILVDDMGHGDITAHGNPVLRTPNFDKLYREGARFTNFAVSPTCSPTRAALMTGRHEFLVGVWGTSGLSNEMDTEVTTIAELFQAKGYRTGIFGKWHLGHEDGRNPGNRGFDETLGAIEDTQNSHFDPVLIQNGMERKFVGYREDILFNQAMAFISRSPSTPFFCYIPTYSPHGPNKVPEKFSRPYEGYINPDRPDGEYSPGFFGQVANVDENLGRLLQFLETSGLTDQTLIIVLNDNGGTRGVDTFNSGMRGLKTTPWRGGTRAYCFWKWSDRFPRGDRPQLGGHIDVFPTLVDLCHLDVPMETLKHLEGTSLRPALEDPGAMLNKDRMQIHHIGRWKNPEAWVHHKYGGCMIRSSNYTLVRHEPCNDENCGTCVTAIQRGIENRRPLYTNNSDHYILTTPGEWELFDIEADPRQERNIAKQRPEIVQQMAEFYEKWWEKVETEMTRKWGRGF